VPQFNFANYSSQIFWLLLCFGIFFSYVKFFFLPKLDGILAQRNSDIKKTQEEIEKNNREAKANFAQSQINITESNALASKVIEDANVKAKFEEESALKEIEAAQRQAIDEILKQQGQLTGESLNAAVVETAEIILKKIGFDVKKSELEELAKK